MQLSRRKREGDKIEGKMQSFSERDKEREHSKDYSGDFFHSVPRRGKYCCKINFKNCLSGMAILVVSATEEVIDAVMTTVQRD